MSEGTSLEWNRQALAHWIEAERQTTGISYIDLEKTLNLHYGTLDWWRLRLVNQLQPKHIEAIARYRNWTPQQVRKWLEIQDIVEA